MSDSEPKTTSKPKASESTKVVAFSPHAEKPDYETTLEKIDADIAKGKWTGAGNDDDASA